MVLISSLSNTEHYDVWYSIIIKAYLGKFLDLLGDGFSVF